MINRLKSFLIEIECPSGAKLVGELNAVAKALAKEFYIDNPRSKTPEGREVPEDLYAYINEEEGRVLNYIFWMPWDSLLAAMTYTGATKVGGLQDDQVAWGVVQHLQRFTDHPNPFVVRIVPKTDAQGEPGLKALDARGISEALTILRQGINDLCPVQGPPDALAVNRTFRNLRLLASALEKALAATPAPVGDGWGHAATADTVDALLREGDAMLEGTDKHEQVFKDMDEKVKTQALARLVTSLQESRTAQIKANQLHDQQIKALEQGMTHLQGEYMALLKSTQKLHRRLGVPTGHYMTESDGLRAKVAEIQKLIAFAKQVEASPLLRQLFALN